VIVGAWNTIMPPAPAPPPPPCFPVALLAPAPEALIMIPFAIVIDVAAIR